MIQTQQETKRFPDLLVGIDATGKEDAWMQVDDPMPVEKLILLLQQWAEKPGRRVFIRPDLR